MNSFLKTSLLVLLVGIVLHYTTNRTSYSSNVLDQKSNAAIYEIKWLNLETVLKELEYFDVSDNMFARFRVPFEVNYSQNEACYIVFTDKTKTSYNTVTHVKQLNELDPLAYLHHFGPCGLCSNLHDFSVYQSNPDLVDKIRWCSINILGDKKRCIEDIGFSQMCAAVWYWNTENTAKHCRLTCLKHLILGTPPNVITGGYDYCKECSNKLGDSHACEDFQWKPGPMRINECLQCDECYSGPVFTRFAGGCRKAYGLEASINRPRPTIDHNYFT